MSSSMYVEGVVFGLLNNASRIPGTKLAEKYRNFTIAWSRYGYHDIILESDSLKDLLRQALEHEYTYCLVQSYGHVISESWIPKHWEQVDFQTALEQWINSHDFFVAGTILETKEGWFGLSDDCVLVNLKYYSSLGKPEFGDPHTQVVEVMKPRENRASGSGNGRLLSLEWLNQTERLRPRNAGWRFVDVSLKNKLPVHNFNQYIDGNRLLLCSPSQQKMEAFTKYLDTGLSNYSSTDLCKELSSEQRKFLNAIDSQVKHSRKGIFLFNLESYKDVLEPPANFNPPLDSIYSVAAGFKPNMILHALGYDDATRVVFFDYSATALEIRKVIVSEWDGEDFPRFVRYLMKKFPPTDVFYQLWADLRPDEIDWEDLHRLWQDEIKKWGGESVIKEHWKLYRSLRHEYICCNLLTEPEKVIAAISKQPNSAIWWSNAFFTVYSNWLHTPEERKKIYDSWIEKLVECNPDIFIYGSDYNNINVNHIRAGEYLERYRVEGRNYLRPCNLYKHELRL